MLYQTIRNAVITGELPPGARVTEMMLAKQFGMSRTPLREAVARLESEQLMIRQPNGALTISPLDREQLSEIYDLQERVEGLVVLSLARMKEKTVAQQLDLVLHSEEGLFGVADFPTICELDLQFHETLWDASRQEQASAILRGFRGLFERYQNLVKVPEDFRARAGAIHTEHQIIRNAIAEGDPVWAEMALKTHVRNSKRFLLAAYRQTFPED